MEVPDEWADISKELGYPAYRHQPTGCVLNATENGHWVLSHKRGQYGKVLGFTELRDVAEPPFTWAGHICLHLAFAQREAQEVLEAFVTYLRDEADIRLCRYEFTKPTAESRWKVRTTYIPLEPSEVADLLARFLGSTPSLSAHQQDAVGVTEEG